MANTSTQKRKPAPSVQTILSQTDERKKLINEHTELDPEYTYAFHRHDVSDYELERNGYEKVMVDGDVVNHNGDPLIRRDRELDKAVRDARQNASYETVKEKLYRADKSGKLRQIARPKKPTNNNPE